MNRAKSLPVMTLAAPARDRRRARKASLRSDSVRKAITGASTRERRSPEKHDLSVGRWVAEAYRRRRRGRHSGAVRVSHPGAHTFPGSHLQRSGRKIRRHLTSDEDRCVGTNEFYKRGSSPKNSRATGLELRIDIHTDHSAVASIQSSSQRCQHRSPCRSPECGPHNRGGCRKKTARCQ